MTEILKVKDLKKEFKDFSLKDINFSMEKGYIMGFIGPNGAGKSTTIKLIMNLLNKDGGTIEIFGLDNIKYENKIKEKIGFVYDQNYYYDELTIAEMKRVIAPFYQNWDNKLYNKYLKLFKLNQRKKIKDLSKGMQMKFSLIIALSHHADLLIMDEPTSGLDPVVRRELLQILSEILQDENKGIFFSTHITSDLDKIADYVTFINDGKIILNNSKDYLLNNYGIVKGKKELLKQIETGNLIGIRVNNYGFEALSIDRARTRKVFGNKVIIDRPTLEDIMLFQIEQEVI